MKLETLISRNSASNRENMATQIKQIDDVQTRKTTLRVSGEMFHEDAALLERIAVEIRSRTGEAVIIDLADLDFLDSDAAPILKRLIELDGFAIDGIEIFLQTIVNDVERHGA